MVGVYRIETTAADNFFSGKSKAIGISRIGKGDDPILVEANNHLALIFDDGSILEFTFFQSLLRLDQIGNDAPDGLISQMRSVHIVQSSTVHSAQSWVPSGRWTFMTEAPVGRALVASCTMVIAA